MDLKGFSKVFSTPRLAGLAVFTAVSTYTLITLASFPEYSIQMLERNILLLDNAVLALTMNTLASTGPIGLGLNITYAFLTGIAISLLSLSLTGVRSLKDVYLIIPGILGSGCASCGAGLLGFLGFTGALAALPFEGNLVKLSGSALLLFFISRTGDPELCELD